MFCNALAASTKNSLTCPLVLDTATRSDPTAAGPAGTAGAGGLHVVGSPSSRGTHQDVLSLAIGSAMFLILEMDSPFDGVMQISGQPVETALEHMVPAGQ
jgi:hypothetical protein